MNPSSISLQHTLQLSRPKAAFLNNSPKLLDEVVAEVGANFHSTGDQGCGSALNPCTGRATAQDVSRATCFSSSSMRA